MTKLNKTKKFAQIKRMINPKDARLKKKEEEKKAIQHEKSKKSKLDGRELKMTEKEKSHLFFQYNNSLGPPYQILIDTNFINFSIQNKLDIFKSMMDCLLAKCIPCVTDCVMGELEKFGQKYRLALRIAKDPRFTRLSCLHKGTYADDCLVDRVKQHRCYIVATCDKDLKRRIRKVAGVPVMYIAGHKYAIERMPDAMGPIASKKA